MDSAERIHEVKKLNELSEKEMVLGEVTGIDFWFESPETKITGPPPKWKMAILTWMAVFPGVVLLSRFYHFIFPGFSSMPITFLVTLSLVPMLTWVLMPNIVKLSKGWLYQNNK